LPSREAVATRSYRRLPGIGEFGVNIRAGELWTGGSRIWPKIQTATPPRCCGYKPGLRSDRTPHECAGGAGPQACGRRPRRPMPTIPIQANANRNPRLEWLRFRGARTRSLLWRLLEQSGQESRDSNPYCPGFLFNQRALNAPILKVTPPKNSITIVSVITYLTNHAEQGRRGYVTGWVGYF
jgi:hypothetical protein